MNTVYLFINPVVDKNRPFNTCEIREVEKEEVWKINTSTEGMTQPELVCKELIRHEVSGYSHTQCCFHLHVLTSHNTDTGSRTLTPCPPYHFPITEHAVIVLPEDLCIMHCKEVVPFYVEYIHEAGSVWLAGVLTSWLTLTFKLVYVQWEKESPGCLPSPLTSCSPQGQSARGRSAQ